MYIKFRAKNCEKAAKEQKLLFFIISFCCWCFSKGFWYHSPQTTTEYLHSTYSDVTKATLSFLELTRPKLLCQIHEYQSHPSISGQSNTNHKASLFDLKPLEWILNAEAGLHSLKYLVVAVLRSQKNAKFRTSVLRCWRLCRLSSKFKIHSKGCKSNGEAL